MALRDDLAADAHKAWMDRMIADGVTTCPSNLTGEEQLVPFAQLSAPIQQYDYDLVDVILRSLDERGYVIHERNESHIPDMGEFRPFFGPEYYAVDEDGDTA